MKKKYMKPIVYLECFELSQNIAAGCKLIRESEGGPIIDAETGMKLFATGSCLITLPNENDEICYHVPIDGLNIFTS